MIIQLNETHSTNAYLNDWCRRHDDRVEELTTVKAEYQLAGKGQMGNSWESERGANLLFSTLLYPAFIAPSRQFVLSQMTALAIQEVLSTYTPGITIKWPNDIYWRDKKMAGILIELCIHTEGIGRCICGVGLNVNQTHFHSPAPNPVSLRQVLGAPVDKEALFERITGRLSHRYALLRRDTEEETAHMQQLYHAALYRREGMHPFRDRNGLFMASITRVEPTGHFVLTDGQGRERSYLFKEVQFVL